ncbi:MAG TPA: methyltransferase domain-containing protein [Gemmatimonadaceae bacterium]|nr:methyltransferase domain-containing protein [Gemmatimonadaceae bacterium]
MNRVAPAAPRRARGTEFLDDPGVDSTIAIRSLADIRRSNRLFGGTRAILDALDHAFDRAMPAHAVGANGVTLLDVGTGAGDIPAAARARAARHGVRLHTVGLERTVPVARAAAPSCGPAVVGDAQLLPFASGAFDVVTCSQVLHHFAGADAERVLRELHRVARHLVIVGDLRRSWIAAAGIWLASWPLAFHPVSRHDGVVSVMRGYSAAELSALVEGATGVAPHVRRRAGFRIVAAWSPR